MADRTARDYLGHPCRTTEALDYFEAEASAARTAAEAEPRSIARNIGIGIMGISEDCDRVLNGLEAALDLLPNTTDIDKTKAVLQFLVQATVSLSHKIGTHAGTTLVVLERSAFRHVSQEGAGHG